MSTITARDFLLHDEAGLLLAGRDEEGELVWMGRTDQWAVYYYLEDREIKGEGDRDRFDFGD